MLMGSLAKKRKPEKSNFSIFYENPNQALRYFTKITPIKNILPTAKFIRYNI
jgi:hypothetical protein